MTNACAASLLALRGNQWWMVFQRTKLKESTMIRSIFVAFALLLTAIQPSFAGPLDEAKAKAHLDAVAAGNLDALMADYPDDVYMDWVGGPLDGRYRGKAAVREVWQKFIAAN